MSAGECQEKRLLFNHRHVNGRSGGQVPALWTEKEKHKAFVLPIDELIIFLCTGQLNIFTFNACEGKDGLSECLAHSKWFRNEKQTILCMKAKRELASINHKLAGYKKILKQMRSLLRVKVCCFSYAKAQMESGTSPGKA